MLSIDWRASCTRSGPAPLMLDVDEALQLHLSL